MDVGQIGKDALSKWEAIRQLCSTNQQLEIDRSNVLQTSSIEPVFTDVISSTANVHVGWLLSSAGRQICRELSLGLDSHEPGWEDLAVHLGLTLDSIRDIRFNRNLDEGPTYTVVWIYAYKDDATIGKLLEALLQMKRYDILWKLREHVVGERGLIRQLQVEGEKWDESDYIYNHLSRNAREFADSLFLKPKIPPLPNKYQVFSTCTAVEMHTLAENMLNRKFCNEGMVTRESSTSVKDSVIVERKQKLPYKAIVMLTFALDGVECAKRIAVTLRKKCIGVLILDEHRDRLVTNPELFITGYFPQVNYVIPILTSGYLKALTATSLAPEPLTSCTDARYVKLIYTLMANQYLKNGCINLNVRCIVPEGNERLLQEHPVACNRPVLQAWLPERDAAVLAQSLLPAAGAS